MSSKNDSSHTCIAFSFACCIRLLIFSTSLAVDKMTIVFGWIFVTSLPPIFSMIVFRAARFRVKLPMQTTSIKYNGGFVCSTFGLNEWCHSQVKNGRRAKGPSRNYGKKSQCLSRVSWTKPMDDPLEKQTLTPKCRHALKLRWLPTVWKLWPGCPFSFRRSVWPAVTVFGTGCVSVRFHYVHILPIRIRVRCKHNPLYRRRTVHRIANTVPMLRTLRYRPTSPISGWKKSFFLVRHAQEKMLRYLSYGMSHLLVTVR